MKSIGTNQDSLLSYIRDGRDLSFRQQLMLVGSLSLPAIMAQLTSVMMQYIDASMVGRLGAAGSAAIGLVSTSSWLFGSVCRALGVGFSVQVAQYIGAGKQEEARSVVRQALVVVAMLSATLALIGILISTGLPGWLGGNENLWADASSYFLIYACSLPALGLNGLAGAMLQCSGNMKVPSILNICMCILDVLLNAILIFPGLTIPIGAGGITIPGFGLGVPGAALGTALAIWMIAGLMLYFLCVRSPELHINWRESFRPEVECQKRAFKITLPVAFEHIVVCGAMIVATRIVAPLGTIALAANSFAITAESLCYMPGYGIADAATTLVGQSIGAGRKKLAWHFSGMTVLVGIAVMTGTGILMFFGAPLMMSLLTPDPQVQELGIRILRIEAFAEPMYAASIVATGVFRGAGDTLIPSILNFISLWLVRLTLSFLLVGNYGLVGVWIAMCLELIFRGIIFLIRLGRKKWLMKEL